MKLRDSAKRNIYRMMNMKEQNLEIYCTFAKHLKGVQILVMSDE